MEKEKIDKLIENLAARNIEGYYFNNFDEAKMRITEMITICTSVGIGNSVTLKNMGITAVLKDRGNIVYDKTQAKTHQAAIELKRKALLTDWYITGTNAISVDGHIVNIDHSGNRVAAMVFGPKKVIIVVGINKITESFDGAICRVRNVASPKNAQRAGLKPPCVDTNACIDCKSDDRVCNNLVIIEGQSEKGRMKVFVVGEEAGF